MMTNPSIERTVEWALNEIVEEHLNLNVSEDRCRNDAGAAWRGVTVWGILRRASGMA